MKKYLKRPDRQERKKTENLIHNFAGLTICAVLAIIVVIGSRVTAIDDNSRVFAASEELELTDGENRVLLTGLSGVVSGIEDTMELERTVQRIGTSCENVMVGQRVRKVDGDIEKFDVSTSMEKAVDNFTAASMSMSSSPKMMSDDDYQTLLRIVEAEAGTEDIKGRVLVANVIMNRVKHEEFPDDVTNVVWQRVNGVPQFSPTYDGRIYTVTVTDDTREAVKQALNGVDYSEGALFFIQKSAAEDHNVEWFESDLKRLFKYGVHEFYKYPDEESDKEEKSKKNA